MLKASTSIFGTVFVLLMFGFFTWSGVQTLDRSDSTLSRLLSDIRAAELDPRDSSRMAALASQTADQDDLPVKVFLPVLRGSECPVSSVASYDLIPVSGPAADRPDYLHGDLNLALRGYNETFADNGLVGYNGGTDSNAPQLAGLFNPNQFPSISSVYQVNNWDWGCGEIGCAAGPITDWEVTLIGLPATRGQEIFIPERGPSIYAGDYKAMVLYAEEKRITLAYTRQDTVAQGYAVHLEDVCVDPNLLALYRQQIGPNGFRATNQLPVLRNDQSLGTAAGDEIKVVIRDTGKFMDPRSCKDWWAKDVNCQSVTLKVQKLHVTGALKTPEFNEQIK